MKIKHTFIFTMLLGLGWAGFLFAYSTGPDPGVNGIFGPTETCNQAGCHVGNALNATGGTITLDGLPAQWTPGASYTLTVTLTRTAALYGFQLSAVFDSNTQQAGTLAKGGTGNDATRIDIITAGGVQYAQHNQFNNSFVPTNKFFVKWTAPASTSGGTVRFNLAGNAANHDGNNTGDFIYTRVDKISPAAAPPPDFSLSAATTANVTAGSSTTLQVTPAGTNGFNGNVSLSIAGLPTGATGSFAPATVAAGVASTLTISTTSAVVAGDYPLVITGTSGALTHTANVTLTVAAPAGSPTRSFTLTNLSSDSSATNGSGATVDVGYVRIQPNASNTTPSGVAVIGSRNSQGILIAETGVPASPLLTSGRIYADVTFPTLRTGLAISNPNNQIANITFFFTDASGNNTTSKATTIAANQQVARFLDEAPYLITSPFLGTFSFTSDVPVGVIALRSLHNERGDDLLSTLPVIDSTLPANTGTQVVPYFYAGGGWTTLVVLVNPTSAAMTGAVQFFNGTNGSPATVQVNGQAASTANYNIAARSSQKFVVSSAAGIGGSVRIVPTGGGAAPVPQTVFTYNPGNITVTEAGAPANGGTAFRMYVESSGVAGTIGNIQSGIAVANTTNAAINVTFELFKPDGTPSGLTPVTLPLTASGQTAKFLAEIFAGQTLPQPFKGVLRISSPAAIAVTGLRGHYNERVQAGGPDFLITTTPPTLESSAAVTAEMSFPQLVNGGGYTTQIVVFSGTAGQTTSGILRFFTYLGATLNLLLN